MVTPYSVVPERFRPPAPAAESGTFSMERASSRAKQFIAQRRIKERSFAKPGAANPDIEADLRLVQSHRAGFERSAVQAGIVLEAAFGDGVNTFGWFGHNARFTHASEFDDVCSGVDGVLEFQDEPDTISLMGLAIDITEETEGIAAKLISIQAGIESGEMAHLKYFQPQHSGMQIKGEWKNIPKFLVISSRKSTQRLAKDWYAGGKAMNGEPLQLNILMQLRIQAQVYANYAEKLGKRHLTEIFRAIDARIKAIIEKKPEALRRLVSASEFGKEPNARLMIGKLASMGFDMAKVKLSGLTG